MNNNSYDQFIREVGVILRPLDPDDPDTLDLSAFRVAFRTSNADTESPGNAIVRIFNLSKKTIDSIIENPKYSRLILSAGYKYGNFGVIFNGDIKQFKTGKSDNTTRFLDIMASEGDIFYNQAVFDQSIAAGVTTIDQLNQLMESHNKENGTSMGIDTSAVLSKGLFNSTNIRGKVWFGIARSPLRDVAHTLNLTWTVRDDKITFTDYRGYKEGEAVVLDSTHGLIGMPEQTEGGIYARCLINPRIRVGGLVKLDNELISKTAFAPSNQEAIAYNRRAPDIIVPLSESGYYRAYVVEHSGDSRGNEWYCDLILLAVDIDVEVVLAGDNI